MSSQIETKVFEIRDKGTFIAAMAIKNLGVNAAQQFYFDSCGFPSDGSSITLMMLYDQKATNDPYEWGGRTMPAAHWWVLEHFNEMKDGDVVDVQVILGETTEKKISERLLSSTI